MKIDLGNKRALVTGATGGIGEAITAALLNAGAEVVVSGTRIEKLAEMESKLGSLGKIVTMPCNLGVPEDITGLVSELSGLDGGIDILINNAGIADFCSIEKTDFATWRKIMSINLDGTFLVSQAAIPALKKTNGSIVNVASISGIRASTLRVAYGTSKAGVIQLTLQQAVELGEYGIRANCICPGPIRTKLSSAVHTQEIIDAYHDAIPLGRYGTEDEIANIITFLCSENARYVTGQVLSADGGFEAAGVGLPALRKSKSKHI